MLLRELLLSCVQLESALSTAISRAQASMALSEFWGKLDFIKSVVHCYTHTKGKKKEKGGGCKKVENGCRRQEKASRWEK